MAATLPGLTDAKLDQQSSISQLRIEANRSRATAYGVTPGGLNEQLSTLLGGKEVAELREGQRVVNLVIRLPVAWRDSPERIAQLPVETSTGQRIPLSLVADVREAKGPECDLSGEQPATLYRGDPSDRARCRYPSGTAAGGGAPARGAVRGVFHHV